MTLTAEKFAVICAAGLLTVSCSTDSRKLEDNSTSLPGLSAEYAQMLADQAEMFGLDDPPQVTPLRVVFRDEYYAVQQSCLADQGFETELGPDGEGLTVELADGQAEAHYLADYICSARFPLHAAYSRDLTEAQLRVYYDWNREEVASCMANRGYEPSEPPSFPVFVETYRSGRGLWAPFDAVADTEFTKTMADLSTHCTLEPPDDDVFGNLG